MTRTFTFLCLFSAVFMGPLRSQSPSDIEKAARIDARVEAMPIWTWSWVETCSDAAKLRAGLTSPDQRFRYGWKAKKEVADIFKDEAWKTLTASKTKVELRRVAAYYLIRIDAGGDLSAFSRLLQKDPDPQIAGQAARALGAPGHLSAPTLVTLSTMIHVRSEITVRIRILRAISRIATRDSKRKASDEIVVSTAVWRAAFDAAMTCLRSHQPLLRRTALETLTKVIPKLQMDPKERQGLTTLLYAMMTEDSAEDVRTGAVEAYALTLPSAFKRSVAEFRQHRSFLMRAAFAKTSLRHDIFRFDQAGLFLADPDPRVRAAALEGLALSQRQERASSYYKALAKERDAVILNLALDGLRQLNLPPTDDEKLRQGYLRAYALMPKSQAETKQSVLKMAKHLGSTQDIAFLERVAHEDPELAIRRLARGHLADLKSPTRPVNMPLALNRAKAKTALALSRQKLHALIHTNRGKIEVELRPDKAPFTVLNFVTLAEKGFYDGIRCHRVVADFVVQVGCPRGDGWGGPGYSIRCEINDLSYERGVMGMALAGQDTGGSQWFLTHSQQFHLDGRYTIFGVTTKGFDVLDSLVQGDWIEKIKILRF